MSEPTQPRWLEDRAARQRAKIALGLSIAITVGLYIVPFGRLVIYPVTLLATLMHELGHGLVAAALGNRFQELTIHPDGSGVAQMVLLDSPGMRAAVAAGGLLGPAVGGAVAFAASTRAKLSRVSLVAFAVTLLLVIALLIRTPFGLVMVGAWAALIGWVGARKSAATCQLVLLFLAVQLALSVFSNGGYLFTDVAVTGSGTLPSDSAQIAAALGGPYWAWGLACGVFSVLVLLFGVWVFFRALREANPASNSATPR